MPVPVYLGANVSIGNGVSTLFPYNFKVLDQTHVEVKVDGVLKVIGTDYTVTGVGNSNGGNVIFVVAPANLAVVQRARKVPYIRTNDYQANGDFKEETVDNDFDLEEMQVQQLAFDVARAFKAPLSVTADQVLTDAMWAARASTYLGFDGAGNIGVFTTFSAGALIVSPYIQTLLDDADAAAARVTLGIPSVAGLGCNLVGGYLDWTVAGNVLTCAVKTLAGNDPSAATPVWYAVRDVTPATGLLSYRAITGALSVAINNTALLGTVNNVPFRLWAVLFNDGGVDRLAIINCLSSVAGPGAGRDITAIFPLSGWGIGTTVLSDNASDNSQVFYANAVTAAKAYATIGYATWEAGLAAAGVWSAGPTRKQLFGPGVPLPGQVIQPQRNDTGAFASGVTQIPFDDTIPQIGEGDQYMAQAVTPSSAANVLSVSVAWNGSPGGAGHLTVALFQDATANALKAVSAAGIDESILVQTLDALILAAGTVATTFKVRAGANVAGTTEFNGRTASRQLGGVFASHIAVSEIMA